MLLLTVHMCVVMALLNVYSYALIIIIMSRYVHDRVTISIPISECPDCASRYIVIILMCSIKRKSGQGKGYIVARGGSIGFSERGLNPIWVVDL